LISLIILLTDFAEAERLNREPTMSSAMDRISWSDELLLGHATIDIQHQDIIDCFNSLVTTLISSDNENFEDKELMDATVHAFSRLIEGHFDYEENQMLLSAYPSAALHKQRHQNFLPRVRAMVDDYDKGKHILSYTIDFLAQWLRYHITTTDKAVVAWLAQRH